MHESDYPEPGTNPVVYQEGVWVGPRGYEHDRIKPLFLLGYGLSYATFTYRNLNIRLGASRLAAADSSGRRVEVSFDVQNTACREGADVAPVYVADPYSKVPTPPMELGGFGGIERKPGESKTSTLTLDRRAFGSHSIQAKAWNVPPHRFDILVGNSRQDIELHGSVSPAVKVQEKGEPSACSASHPL